MVRRTITYYKFNLRPKKTKNCDITRSVDDDGSGRSVIPYLVNFLECKQGMILKNEYRKNIVGIRSFENYGRSVLINAVTGPFGEKTQVINVLSGKVVKDIEEDESPAKEVRILFCCPRGVQFAIVAAESVDGKDAMQVIEEFARGLRRIFSDCFCPVQQIVENNSWLENADLKQLSVITKTPKPVILEDGIPDQATIEEYGCLKWVITPPKGKKFLGRKFYKDLLARKRSGGGLLTLPDILDHESMDDLIIETTIEGQDGRTKTIPLGDAKTPTIREILSNHGEARPDDEHFRMRVLDSVFNKYLTLGIRLKEKWEENKKEELKISDVDWNTDDETKSEKQE